MSAARGSRKELIEDLVLEVAHQMGVGGIQIIGWSGPGILRREARLVICIMGRDRVLHFPKKYLGSGAQIDGQSPESALAEMIRSQLKTS